ncbi:class I SAM-dependent methyltransferase [Desulfoferula mesophila]|uniref:Nodulation protein NoeA n=1 Tax=Desulfoferula mesophila TaxID=3058419 RepID=A0AAU9EGY2_9BACT|nr:nodulation protein NoeA [Desulfoferula mesophilus]
MKPGSDLPATPNIVLDPNSYVDPMARVFSQQDEILRAFFPHCSDFYRTILYDPTVLALMDQGKIVRTHEKAEITLPGFDLVVSHQRISRKNYSYEWPFSMLREAALVTLDIAIQLIEKKITLQDAASFNVFFKDTHPVFIDFSSLVTDDEQYLWAAYQQFCHHFLFPLYIHAAGKSSLVLSLLKDNLDGINARQTSQALGLSHKLVLRDYFSRLAIPEFFAGKLGRAQDRSYMSTTSGKIMNFVNTTKAKLRFFTSLRRTVEKIKGPRMRREWVDYYNQTDEGQLQRKQEAVSRVLDHLQYSTVVDVGCNLGNFACLAAQKGVKVTALDADPDCIERLFIKARQKNLTILPLVADLTNPSPMLGWRNLEYDTLPHRIKADAVLALALMHHLIFSSGWNFDRTLGALKEFQNEALLVEYVDINDPMTKRLPRRPGVDYGWYDLENFKEALGRHFRKVDQVKRLSDTRVLFLGQEPLD